MNLLTLMRRGLGPLPLAPGTVRMNRSVRKELAVPPVVAPAFSLTCLISGFSYTVRFSTMSSSRVEWKMCSNSQDTLQSYFQGCCVLSCLRGASTGCAGGLRGAETVGAGRQLCVLEHQLCVLRHQLRVLRHHLRVLEHQLCVLAHGFVRAVGTCAGSAGQQ